MTKKVTDYLKEAPILLNETFSDRTELFTAVNQIVVEKDWVTDEFLTKIIEREQVFPTGLDQGTYGIAIPHTDPECVKREFIAFVMPKEPVMFQRMDDANLEVPARFVFILGLNQPHQQLAMLQNLMGLMQHTELLAQLATKTTAQEILELLEVHGF
jgi:Phosphotransferase system mannitol/fructose-specific IIA domain (Ntr-type)